MKETLLHQGFYHIIPDPKKDPEKDPDWWWIKIDRGDFTDVVVKFCDLQFKPTEEQPVPDLTRVAFSYEILVVPDEVANKDKDALDDLVCNIMLEIMEGLWYHNSQAKIEGEVSGSDDE